MKKQTVIKRYMLFCEPCSHKQILQSDEHPELSEIPTADVPGGAPVYDPLQKKTIVKKSMPQPKKYKCPKCGRGVSLKKLPDVYASLFKKAEQEEQERKNQEAKELLEKEKAALNENKSLPT